eukprot:31149-Pelagococcus_subviridis.AAC.2
MRTDAPVAVAAAGRPRLLHRVVGVGVVVVGGHLHSVVVQHRVCSVGVAAVMFQKRAAAAATEGRSIQSDERRGGVHRRQVEIGVHHANAVVWGPVYRTRLLSASSFPVHFATCSLAASATFAARALCASCASSTCERIFSRASSTCALVFSTESLACSARASRVSVACACHAAAASPSAASAAVIADLKCSCAASTRDIAASCFARA